MTDKPHTITALLLDWRAGNTEAMRRLIDLVYDELHRMAVRQMHREHGGHTLQATALVHEAYLRLCGSETIEWQDRAHFFAVVAQQMRRVLVDHARRRQAEKRGAGQVHFSLSEFDGEVLHSETGLLSLDEALTRLRSLDERAAQVVELRYFGGFSESEVAQALNISVATMKRDWTFARAWLSSQLI
jgi:RNA polymerase sigma factor (TIGR02999 family)